MFSLQKSINVIKWITSLTFGSLSSSEHMLAAYTVVFTNKWFNAIQVREWVYCRSWTKRKHVATSWTSVPCVYSLGFQVFYSLWGKSHSVASPCSHAVKDNLLKHFRRNRRIWSNDKSIWWACWVSKLVEVIRCWLAPAEEEQLQAHMSATVLSRPRSHVLDSSVCKIKQPWA